MYFLSIKEWCVTFLHFQGTFQSAGVIQHAYNFNQPISVVPGRVTPGTKVSSFFFFHCYTPN